MRKLLYGTYIANSYKIPYDSRYSENIKLLEKINNIDEDFSENEQEISGTEGGTKGNSYDLFL